MEPLDALAQAKRQGRRVALVTVLAVEGDAPSHPGAKLLADHSGPLAGTLGCSEFDTAGLELARQALDGQRTVRRRLLFSGRSLPGPLEAERSSGTKFPGHGRERAIELFAEVSEPDTGLIVIGANPVAHAIAAVAVAVGRRVGIIADSGDLREEPGVQIERGAPAAVLAERSLTSTDAVVVSDHDAPWVDDVLRVALASEAGFVGMLGSRRHAPAAVERLRHQGVGVADLARLHSPCGLDIGSRTPGEIALSIVAEIVAHERGRPGGPMSRDWTQLPFQTAQD